MRQPLEGVRVVDLTQFLAGPFCTMLLGDMGAEVVKIENPRVGDPTRTHGAMVGGESSYFLSINRNKRSMALDLKAETGKAVLRRLIERGDILVENFRPGVLERLGFGWDCLRELNPRLIYCAISGFGDTGPYSQRPAYDQIVQGMSGLMAITGTRESGPFRLGLAIGDITGALFGTLGILLALFDRERTGEGQRVSTSLLEAVVGILSFQAQNFFVTGQPLPPAGNDHPVIAPCGVFKTRDGLINICVGSEEMWGRLCSALGLEHLRDDPRFSENSRRMANRDELRELLNEALSTKASQGTIEELNRAGVTCGPIYRIDEVFSDRHVLERRMVEEFLHPTAGRLKTVGFPLKFSGLEGRVRRPPPTLGQHTEEVLGELGYSAREIEELKSSGALG